MRKFKRTILLLLCIVFIFGTTACGKKKDNEPIVKCNKTEISDRELNFWKASVTAGYESTSIGSQVWLDEKSKTEAKEQLKELLEKLVIIKEKARELNIALSDEQKTMAETQANEIIKDFTAEDLSKYNLDIDTIKTAMESNALVSAVISKVTENYTADEQAIADILGNDEEYVYFTTTPVDDILNENAQAKVKHILLKTFIGDTYTAENEFSEEETLKVKEKAEAILEEIKNGKDFATAVKEYSEDTGSVETGGEYTFSKGQMVKEFEDAGFSMEKGEYRIVKSDYGYHIMLSEGLVLPDKQQFETALEEYKVNAKTAAEQSLRTGEFEKTYAEWIKELKAEFNEKKWEKVEFGEGLGE